MKAKPNRYADSVCCISAGVACSDCAMPAKAGMYVSIEKGPSMPSRASRKARAQRGARQSWSASGFMPRLSPRASGQVDESGHTGCAGEVREFLVRLFLPRRNRIGPDGDVLRGHRARRGEPAIHVAEVFHVVQ